MAKLRTGFTTGTCAAAASKAAALALQGRKETGEVEISLPDGERVCIPLMRAVKKRERAEAAVRKDAGDDPDVTDGLAVVASASWMGGDEILLKAGEGVGRVTKPGLSVPPGEPAINPIPRRMIHAALREVTQQGIQITLSIPGGEQVAAKTFNPRLGIVGGLSILGTSGRVRPFSCSALRASLRCALEVAAACGIEAPVFVPGRIGEKAARRLLPLAPEQAIEVGNEWGFMLDQAARHDFKGLLILGHPGKLAKLAMGKWNTHSARSPSAVPFVSELGANFVGGISPDIPTVEGVFCSLRPGEQKTLGEILAAKISEATFRRVRGRFPVTAVLVNLKGDCLGSSGGLSLWKSEDP